jgi:hypothetical protein
MSSHITSRPRHTRFDPSIQPEATTAVATSSTVSNKWQIDLSNPVNVVALPVEFTVNGAPPTAYVQDSPTRITLTYAVNVAAGQTWVIPDRSPNVRTPTGGFVAAATGTF